MGKNDDGLGLSLSLGCGATQPSLKLNLMQKPSPPMQYHHQKTPWNEIFQLSSGNPFFFTFSFFFFGKNIFHIYLIMNIQHATLFYHKGFFVTCIS